MATQDPISVIKSFDSKWNAHDEEGILALMSDDVVIKLSPAPPPPLRELIRGKEQAREFVQTILPGFHVSPRDYKVSGNKVTWKFTVTSDAFREMGLDEATGTAEAVVEQGKLNSLHPTFDEATTRKLEAA